jgi:hypothetical protein
MYSASRSFPSVTASARCSLSPVSRAAHSPPKACPLLRPHANETRAACKGESSEICSRASSLPVVLAVPSHRPFCWLLCTDLVSVILLCSPLAHTYTHSQGSGRRPNPRATPSHACVCPASSRSSLPRPLNCSSVDRSRPDQRTSAGDAGEGKGERERGGRGRTKRKEDAG